MWNYDPANFWTGSQFDTRSFWCSFELEPPGGRCSVTLTPVATYNCVCGLGQSDWTISRSGRSSTHQRCVDCIATGRLSKWGHFAATPLVHNWSPALTPPKQPHLVAALHCRNSYRSNWRNDSSLECRKEMRSVTFLLQRAGDDFVCTYIWTYIPNYLSRLIVIYLKWGQIHCNQCQTLSVPKVSRGS